MIGEQRSEYDDELECGRFLRAKGLPVSELMIPDFQRWRFGGESYDSFRRQFDVRHDYIREFGFAVLTLKAIEVMRPYAPLLEIGAGSGYWSYELNRLGVDTIPTDDYSGEYGHFSKGGTPRRWKHIYGSPPEKLNHLDAIRKYPSRNLLFVWPDMDSWAAESLSIFTGNTVIYVGEGEYGCTADDQFHQLFNERFSDQITLGIPQFLGVHDTLTIGRKPKQLQ